MDMFETLDGIALLGRRMEAYAEARLSPDLTTSSRLRARVLAVAHRRAELARAGTGLTVLPRPEATSGARSTHAAGARSHPAGERRGRARWHRAAGVLLAASVGIGMTAGGAYAARPSGPLYEARLWAETLALPQDPSARAVAELERLEHRLGEVAEADRAGDAAGVRAALAAYQSIVDEASTSAILAEDDVAAAILETGVGRNVEVLQALIGRVPSRASAAIASAVDRAIAHSNRAVSRIAASRTANAGGGGGTGDGAGGGQPAREATPRPTKAPTAKPATTPAATATPKPRPTPKVTAEPTPEATAEPTGTPPPDDDQGRPGQPGPNPGRGSGPRLQGG